MNQSAMCGVRIAGSGAGIPARVLSNQDLERMVDTSHEWIVQRTGIERRHIIDQATESQATLAGQALRRAISNAGMSPSQLDLVINATVTAEMTCPSNACRIAHEIGAAPAGAFDLVAACSGFVYSMNLAESLIRCGRYRTVGLVGCDVLSGSVDYTERSVSILFGDGAGAMILTRDDDARRGCLYQAMGADGSGWHSLYMPRRQQEVPASDATNPIPIGLLRMNGREVYKFAVNKFREVIEDAMAATGLKVDDVAQFVCHQSNIRIIEAAMERLDLPKEKVHINIAEYGNTSAGSVPIVYDEIRRLGRVGEGDVVVFIAFGGGLTWASSVWRI